VGGKDGMVGGATLGALGGEIAGSIAGTRHGADKNARLGRLKSHYVVQKSADPFEVFSKDIAFTPKQAAKMLRDHANRPNARAKDIGGGAAKGGLIGGVTGGALSGAHGRDEFLIGSALGAGLGAATGAAVGAGNKGRQLKAANRLDSVSKVKKAERPEEAKKGQHPPEVHAYIAEKKKDLSKSHDAFLVDIEKFDGFGAAKNVIPGIRQAGSLAAGAVKTNPMAAGVAGGAVGGGLMGKKKVRDAIGGAAGVGAGIGAAKGLGAFKAFKAI
jgi:uncharacterized protein YcfJ